MTWHSVDMMHHLVKCPVWLHLSAATLHQCMCTSKPLHSEMSLYDSWLVAPWLDVHVRHCVSALWCACVLVCNLFTRAPWHWQKFIKNLQSLCAVWHSLRSLPLCRVYLVCIMSFLWHGSVVLVMQTATLVNTMEDGQPPFRGRCCLGEHCKWCLGDHASFHISMQDNTRGGNHGDLWLVQSAM